MNLFWVPGGIYANGVTGFAQLVVALSGKFHLPMLDLATLVLLINVPLLVIAWFKIDRKFTIFTIIAVFLTSVFMKLIPVMALTNDPVICTVFGGVIHGLGVGITLNSDFSTGGLDIIGILVRKVTTRSIGTIFTAFNLAIEFIAGFVFGWPYAFYSALSIFVNGKVMDMVYTRQQKMQVMIVTDKPRKVIDHIQNRMRRGITIVHDAEGAYQHDEKTILFTVISRYEMHDLQAAMRDSDPKAFVSISDTVKILGHFYEPMI